MRKSLKSNVPTSFQMVEHYLRHYYAHKPAAVFFNPLGSHLAIASLTSVDVGDLINADIFIHLVPGTKLGSFVNKLDEKTYGFVVGWDGSKIVTENT